MGFLDDMSREYMRHRLYGGHRHHRGSRWAAPRGYWGAPRHSAGHWMAERRYGGPFVARRPRSRVQVRGCGCCLPIPLALVTGGAVAARELMLARSR